MRSTLDGSTKTYSHFFMLEKNWYKPKAFTHFTPKLYELDSKFVEDYVSDSNNILKHSFHPLIHKTIAVKRFKKSKDKLGKEVKRHYTFVNGKRKSNVKYREVYYPTHLDSHIYSFYTNRILGPLYETELKKIEKLDNAVLAYRRIEVINGNRCKCNIDFANDLFELVKSLEGDHAVLALDISKFFDSLNHKKLKQAWCGLQKRTNLKPEEYNIFKSLVNFRYVEMQDICKEFGFEHHNDIIKQKIKCFVRDKIEFKRRIVDKGYIKKNPFRVKNTSEKKSSKNLPIGIPQGTPISAFLANLYLLEFDKKVLELLHDCKGTYRRYSDDLVIICPVNEYEEIEKKIYKLILDYDLIIQKEKTQTTFFINGKLNKGEKPLAYLGFIFDGNRKFIRSSSLSKYYRKMKAKIKYKAFRALFYKPKLKNGKLEKQDFLIHRTEIYKKFSHLGSKNKNPKKRNYISYANLATQIMNSPEIKKQVSKAWKTIHQDINKWSSKLNLEKLKKTETV